ncbi:helicase-associated domain-containing protein [Actinomadura sp. DC4]|uniref:helicase-associated domain-containing protein n=1 Tax=Actinomadura sp. DC4 TaxID=3055069 RepID=UPI0025AFF6E7|nr:helicase-associated domain-containing protein [Actinomadura sp. DC4]MDN3352189.1 helicase-associated domain-containing protein [Actinomadura sp. DC4]
MTIEESLACWLESLDVGRYRDLLAARADAVLLWHLGDPRVDVRGFAGPGPADEPIQGTDPAPGDLVGPLLAPSSAVAAAERLTTPQIQVLETVQVLGDGCRRADLPLLLDVPDPSALDRVLGELAGLALVWPEGERLRLGAATASLETRPGGPLGAGLGLEVLLPDLPNRALREIALNLGLNIRGAGHRDTLTGLVSRALADRDLVRSVAARAPARTGGILTRLASFGLPGSPGTDSESITMNDVVWAAEHGLVILDGHLLAMPREVRLALRGEDYRAPFEPAPPAPAVVAADSAPGTAAHAAMRAVELTEAALHACAAAPLTPLKTGGVGVRDLRRLAKATDGEITTLRLVLEIAQEAGLLAWERDAALPTAEFDAWLATSPVDRLATILDAWWRMERLPLLDPGEGAKPEPCLDPDAVEPYAPRLRVAFARTAATVPSGHAATGPDALVDGMLWRLPFDFEDPADAGFFAAALWAEATALGVIADGRPSALLGGLVEGGVGSSVKELFADQLTTALFQNDLTVVVTGLPSLDMGELLDSVADREARGAASTWRFSPDSMRRGLDRGRSAGDLTEELTAMSRTGGLPNTLTRLIEDVARRHGEVRVVASGCCLRVADDALAIELTRARSLTRLALRTIAPGVLVSARGPSETLRLLRQAGYVPAAEAQDGTPYVERSTARAGAR